jgi:hypothetical protein
LLSALWRGFIGFLLIEHPACDVILPHA